ncbi:hypothetical protein Dsin_012463 [Dipteronia sinensis]|uniref:RNase H type-1 domain-containing protein n=1 Tax=Dipteronia sinensis TaxID=43782 RepID=A0AAE0AIL4_9ROSI|nr:hypothetical protein Dsin_012463 [Dipteronia sinensis]
MESKGGRIRIGVVIRDFGSVMASCCQVIGVRYDAKAAEMVAIYRGLQFSIDCGLAPCVIESVAAVC